MAPGSPHLLIRFDSEVGNFLRDLEAAVGGTEQLRAGLAGIAVVAGAVSATTIALGSTAIATGRQFEQLQARLKTTLGSEGAAQAAFKNIQAFASSTPFAVSEITEAFISLKNRGIEPTNETLRKLGDLAGSQGKPLQQIVEAVIDSASGANDRLTEIGVQAETVGNKVRFTFKDTIREVEKTPQAIAGALASFGEIKGVLGGMAEQSATLDGQLSNLGDSSDTVSRQFYTLAEGPLKATVAAASSLI